MKNVYVYTLIMSLISLLTVFNGNINVVIEMQAVAEDCITNVNIDTNDTKIFSETGEEIGVIRIAA